MKIVVAASVALVLFLGSLPAGAEGGNAEGNGGGAIVCTGTDGAIASAKLLDLWEAERVGTVIPRSDEPKQVQLERALKLVGAANPDLAARMREVLKSLEGRIIPISGDYQLAPPTDTNLRLLKKERNCSLQGAASFDDESGLLFVDGEILAAMSPTDQAALEFHEALYRVQRTGPAKARESTKARKLTAAVFSEGTLRFVLPSDGVGAAAFECDAEGRFHFFIVNLPDGRVRFQFTRIDGRPLLDRTTYDTRYGARSKMLVLKASQGFLPSKRAVRDSKESTAWYSGRFRTASEFEPGVALAIRAVDEANHCQPGSSTCYHWVWDRPDVYVNHSVVIGLDARFSAEAFKVSCRRL